MRTQKMTDLIVLVALFAVICGVITATLLHLGDPRETGETLRYYGEHEL
jgi:hypothetical protein